MGKTFFCPMVSTEPIASQISQEKLTTLGDVPNPLDSNFDAAPTKVPLRAL